MKCFTWNQEAMKLQDDIEECEDIVALRLIAHQLILRMYLEVDNAY